MKALGFLLLWMLAAAPCWADPQEFEFQAPAAAADAGTAALMRDLAERILPVYEEQDPDLYLENLSVLQLAAGDFESANDTRKSLRERRESAGAALSADRAIPMDFYAQAKAAEAAGGSSFEGAFRQSFQDLVPGLSDRDAYTVTARLQAPLFEFENALQVSLDRLRGQPNIDLPQAIDLLRTYLLFEAHRSFAGLAEGMDEQDRRRRYLSEDAASIGSRGGAELQIRVVRPKSASNALPALLEFAVSDGDNSAEACAAHGYVGVTASIGRKDGTRSLVFPFERDGEEARAVIAWIVKQPWSDGRVGMYGDGYSGFAAWAAAKQLPRALKAIATSDAMAPGIDFPMPGRIYRNEALQWAADTIHGQAQSAAGPADGDEARWRALDLAWYQSGKRYRDFARMAREPAPARIFNRWLNHPSYDLYWKKMIPSAKQFARIDIPVLATTGYYADGEAGALYYFTQHYRYRPKADHTLLIGPYVDGAARGVLSAVARGAPIDSAGRLDLQELRYQWFDYIFKGTAKPPLLKDRVNYELMGANQWQHAPSVEAMANGTSRFYLTGGGAAAPHPLAQAESSGAAFVPLAVNFADRSDANLPPTAAIVGKSPAAGHELMFASEPLQQPIEVGGPLAGRLDFKVNKRDMDLNLTLYELLPGGDYLELSDPYEFRASYARNRTHRHLLKAGKRQQLTFRSERLMSREVPPGSRLILVLGVNKRPDREINYGSGGDVSEESLKNARIPLKIQWYSGSFIDIPVENRPAVPPSASSPQQPAQPALDRPDERDSLSKPLK